jgi:hypothetical protein
MPACIWNMLVCVAGPLDTGQFLTYLYILLLPVIIINLIYLTYPTKIVAKVITGFLASPGETSRHSPHQSQEIQES